MACKSNVDPNILSSVSNAIAIQEGFGAANKNNKPNRTNNPGDLGNTDAGATVTYTGNAGWGALDNQVCLFFTGGSGTRYGPNMTFTQIQQAGYATDPNWGPGVAAHLGVPPNATMNDIASGKYPIRNIARPLASGNETPFQGVDTTNAPEAQPVSGTLYSADQIGSIQNALDPALVINSHLGDTAWFDDPAILQVNGATSSISPSGTGPFSDL